MQQNLRITLEGAQPIDAEFAMSPHDAANPPSLSTFVSRPQILGSPAFHFSFHSSAFSKHPCEP
jgi:hypothetical protein